MIKNKEKLKDNLGRYVEVFDNPKDKVEGHTGVIIEFDATSKGEVSYYVLPDKYFELLKSTKDVFGLLNKTKCHKSSNLRILKYKKPSKLPKIIGGILLLVAGIGVGFLL